MRLFYKGLAPGGKAFLMKNSVNRSSRIERDDLLLRMGIGAGYVRERNSKTSRKVQDKNRRRLTGSFYAGKLRAVKILEEWCVRTSGLGGGGGLRHCKIGDA